MATSSRTAKQGTTTRRARNSQSVSKPKALKIAVQRSKTDELIKLLRKRGGASLAELQKATGWQPHSVRGFLSGTVKKRLGHVLLSKKSADGVRRYVIGAS